MVAQESMDLDYSKYDFKYSTKDYVYKSEKGLCREVVESISDIKKEHHWMREFRLKALEIFYKKNPLTWGGDLLKINYDNIYYSSKPSDKSK